MTPSRASAQSEVGDHEFPGCRAKIQRSFHMVRENFSPTAKLVSLILLLPHSSFSPTANLVSLILLLPHSSENNFFR